MTWFEFVQEILRASGHPVDMVRPIGSADLDPPRPAPRPANSVLDNARWRAAGLAPLRDFREPLRELIAAGFTLVDLVEPEWPQGHERTWGQWSPLRGRLFPGTAIFCTVKP